MLYAVILAGGSGTRLWPRSRQAMPKQFLDIVGKRTMLQEAADRIEPLVPPERTFVITNQEYVPIVQEQLPRLPAANTIGETSGRGTAPAIGLAATVLRRLDPSAIMVVLTADHLIAEREHFRDALQAAVDVAEEGYLVTLGIRASYAETGYGYIERGQFLEKARGFDAYRVVRFAEKPDLQTAQSFVDSGNYSWNSGMFIWRVTDILAEMQRLMPKLYVQLREIGRHLGTDEEGSTYQRVWPQITRQTIDFGVMEHARNVAILPVDIGWSDVGSWATLLDVLPADKDGNVVAGEVECVDTRHSLIYSPGRLIATIGLKDFIVVDTGDVMLICPKDRAQDVRIIVDRLQERGRQDLVRDVPRIDLKD
jgi:mannose-1-phosphate guanylyltransferase